jgi:pteridine reductase
VKLALVTGGHRRLGAAIAARLSTDGWTVAIHGAHEDIAADLGDTAAVEGLIPRVIERYGQVPALLVNNASRFEWDDAATATAKSMDAHYNVNARAPVMLALALAKLGGEGSVVNILDQRVRNPNADQFSYTLSKTALAAATRALAVSLAPRLRINAVAPGLTLPTADYDDAAMARAAAAMPLGRLPEPGDVADAVAYLAGAEAVTGQTLFVDGGASLKSFDRDFLYL